ncbi:LysR family transcriptional regulator [Acinetobacter haemolyticus]|nr:LysR family transcriptional regulator [Acinetobacter haemolyticus]
MQKLPCHQLVSEHEEWKELVYSRIDELGSIQKVADELGYARTSVSLALRDKYVGSTEKLVKRVYEVLSQVQCPYLNQAITFAKCKGYEEREAPTQNPSEMRHWRACKSCEVGYNKRLEHDHKV